MKKYLLILFVAFVVSQGFAFNFKTVATLPEGQDGYYGFIRVFDTNHNGLKELIFNSYRGLGNWYIIDYEYALNNQYSILDTIAFYYGDGWTLGYIDNDSLADIIIQRRDTIIVFESPSYDSCPTKKVWGSSIKTISVAPSYITDLDKDGNKEILTSNIAAESVFIFECTADNQYDLVYTNNVTAYGGNILAFAHDDFDRDSLREFVTGGIEGQVVLWECTGPDQYQVVWNDTVIAPNAYDVVSANDMDQDGKPEFIIGACRFASFNHTAVWTFCESNGLNSYAPIFIDSLTNIDGSYYKAVSYCGDIDNDSIPEAVLAVGSNWVIYKATGDNQFQRIYKAYATDNGRSNTSICIADMNGNGYAEIIESGSIDSAGFTIGGETKIWEIMGEVTFDSLRLTQLDSCIQVKWATSKQFANYGFSVYRSTALGGPYSIIYETNDTIRLDTTLLNYTYNDSNVTTGTWYYYKVQAKLLNDSTQFFGPDSALGVEGRPGEGIPNIEFRMDQNAPNPFAHSTTIKYQIPQAGNLSLKVYNVAGQLVKILIDENTNPLRSGEGREGSITWDGRDQNNQKVSNGVYFYKLQAGNQQAIKKLIVLR